MNSSFIKDKITELVEEFKGLKEDLHAIATANYDGTTKLISVIDEQSFKQRFSNLNNNWAGQKNREYRKKYAQIKNSHTEMSQLIDEIITIGENIIKTINVFGADVNNTEISLSQTVTSLYAQFQIKINDLERLKTTFSKLSTENVGDVIIASLIAEKLNGLVSLLTSSPIEENIKTIYWGILYNFISEKIKDDDSDEYAEYVDKFVESHQWIISKLSELKNIQQNANHTVESRMQILTNILTRLINNDNYLKKNTANEYKKLFKEEISNGNSYNLDKIKEYFVTGNI